MKIRSLCCWSVLIVVGSSAFVESVGAAPELWVGEDQRHLVREDGTPFFWLGDTAWELFHRLDREEADRYLEDRARKGFTVIQVVALAELDGLHTPNAYGHLPLIADDPSRPAVKDGPNNDYWDHVDYIVNKAESLGMFTGLLPTWGDKWVKRWGVGPEVFTADTAEAYGEFLGKRYKGRAIVWILGGDRNPDNETHLAITRRMAKGIERGNGGTHLMTYHPQGGSNSAEWFHGDDWLDLNMVQSGHGRPAKPAHQHMRENRARRPLKPTLDGEPCYEDHPLKSRVWSRRNEPGVYLPWFDEWDVRVQAYQSMLAGACGHTYGNHNIWQMWQPGREPISIARTPWSEAIHHPGAQQMGYMRGLFEARRFQELEPDLSLVIDNSDKEPVLAARHRKGHCALFYLPEGEAIEADLGKLSGEKLRAWWFNPRQNTSQLIGEFRKSARKRFQPPFSGRNNDWILIIDDASRELPRIGTSYQHFVPR